MATPIAIVECLGTEQSFLNRRQAFHLSDCDADDGLDREYLIEPVKITAVEAMRISDPQLPDILDIQQPREPFFDAAHAFASLFISALSSVQVG